MLFYPKEGVPGSYGAFPALVLAARYKDSLLLLIVEMHVAQLIPLSSSEAEQAGQTTWIAIPQLGSSALHTDICIRTPDTRP